MRLKSFFIAGLAVAVVSCSFSGPGAMLRGTYYGVEYSTVSEAEQVRSRARSTALAEITPLPSPLIKKKLTVSIPTLASLRKYRNAVDPPAWYKAAQYGRDFLDKDLADSAEFLGEAIRQRRLYESVEIIDVEVSAPEPTPTPVSDHLYWRFNPVMWGSQIFFTSVKTGRFAVTPDNSASSLRDSTESLINTISRLARM